MSRSLSEEIVAMLAATPVLLGPLLLLLKEQESKGQNGETVTNTTVPVLEGDCLNTGDLNKSSLQRADFTQQLDARLRGLSVRGFERLIAQLLRASGYEQVRILRDHRVKRRSHKGRNQHGGVDITAVLKAEFGVTSVLVQVKQYQRPVSRRFVDELRGALLRTQARQGLLITTSTFAPAARKAALEDHIGPVQLIENCQLRELLVTHQLGVKRNARGQDVVRPRFFRRMDKLPAQAVLAEEESVERQTVQ